MPSTGTPSLQTAAGTRGGSAVGHRFGAAGKDDALRLEFADRGIRDIPGMHLAVHAELAHAARDQLRVLRAEVEDQDPVGVDV